MEIKEKKREKYKSLLDALKENEGKLYGMAYGILKNYHDAEDVMQDVAIKAWKSLNQFEGRSSIKTWLYQITRNTSISYLKRRIKRNVVTETDDFEMDDLANEELNPLERMLSKENSKGLFEEIINLEVKHYEILLLYLVEDESYKEISERMKISIGTVKSRLSRARTQLKENCKRKKIHYI